MLLACGRAARSQIAAPRTHYRRERAQRPRMDWRQTRRAVSPWHGRLFQQFAIFAICRKLGGRPSPAAEPQGLGRPIGGADLLSNFESIHLYGADTGTVSSMSAQRKLEFLASGAATIWSYPSPDRRRRIPDWKGRNADPPKCMLFSARTLPLAEDASSAQGWTQICPVSFADCGVARRRPVQGHICVPSLCGVTASHNLPA